MFAVTGEYAFSLCKNGKSHMRIKLITRKEKISIELVFERTRGNLFLQSDLLHGLHGTVSRNPGRRGIFDPYRPPYGISYQNHFAKHPHPLLTGDTGIDYKQLARESYRILQHNAHAYFFTRFDCYPEHYACLQEAGFQIKNCLVIEKNTIGGLGDLQGSFANNAEWLIFCQKGRRAFNHTTLLQNRKKEGTLFHAGRSPSKKYKTRFPACWFGEEYPKATYNSTWQKKNQIFILR